MDGFFLPQVLDTTRLRVLTESRVENPPFFVPLRRVGLPACQLLHHGGGDLLEMVVSHQPFSDRLLFHELVHVEQYRQLGIPPFAKLYVPGITRAEEAYTWETY